MDIIKGRLLFDAFSDVFMSCICFADTVNICGNKHIFIFIVIDEPVTLNLESSRTCRSPLTRAGCNRTVLTSLQIYICSVCNVDFWRQRPYIQPHQFDFIFHTVYSRINGKDHPKQSHFRWKRPCALIKFVFCP